MSKNLMALVLLPLIGCGTLAPQEPAPVDVVVDVETPPADDAGEAGDENTAMDEAAGGEVDTDAGGAEGADEAPVAVDETTTTKTTTTKTTTTKKVVPVVSTGNRTGTTESVKPVTGNRSATTESATSKPRTTTTSGGNRSGTK